MITLLNAAYRVVNGLKGQYIRWIINSGECANDGNLIGDKESGEQVSRRAKAAVVDFFRLYGQQ